MAVRLLLTGFESFKTFKVNPSWEAAKSVSQAFADDVGAALLPVDYLFANKLLYEALDRYQPQDCICMGLAKGDFFRLETVARKPKQFANLPGEQLLKGNWPWDQAEQVLKNADVPVKRSTDTGKFVCESTYWSLLDYRSKNNTPQNCMFLHVPAVSEEFPVNRTTDAVKALVRDWLNNK